MEMIQVRVMHDFDDLTHYKFDHLYLTILGKYYIP